MTFLNLGILAHVDAGKTSLTERLLYAAGVIDEIGRVDDGSTRTDSLVLERQRGITIRSAVVSFEIGDRTVNLIDTPGHPDFIAEVERVLGVLDGAVLVVSAVEGVQAQTRILMRALQRLRIPTLVFVNKIDRGGADAERVVRDVAAKLTPALVAMGTARGQGTRGARFEPHGPGGVDVLAEHDDTILADYVDGTTVPPHRLHAALATQTARAQAHPVFLGSAITGAGIEALMAGITEFLPVVSTGDGPVAGTVFKVERGPDGEKIAYARLFAGTVRTRDRLRLGDGDAKVTGIEVFHRGAAQRRPAVTAGEIARLWGLGGVRVGDAIGDARTPEPRHFAPPGLETVVTPARAADRGALHVALTQLAEQDPLIALRQDPVRRETSVSLYGEVQKEVIAATLAQEYGLDVRFRATTTICVERVVGTGTAVEVMGAEDNPFLATVGLRVEPARVGAGIAFGLEIELGALPLSFLTAIEETVRSTLTEGIHGWAVPDAVVTLTRSGYAPRQSHAHATFDKSMSSTAGDFRLLTPLVVMSALGRAGTVVHEPVHRFRLELPVDALGVVLPALARLQAVPGPPAVRGAECVVEGEIPAARVHDLQQRLPGFSRGEGVLESSFCGHRLVAGAPPARSRTDHDPLDRAAYLLRVVQRV